MTWKPARSAEANAVTSRSSSATWRTTVTDSLGADSRGSVDCVGGRDGSWRAGPASRASLPWSLGGGAKIGGADIALPSVQVVGTRAARLRKPRSDRIVLAASGRYSCAEPWLRSNVTPTTSRTIVAIRLLPHRVPQW